jgi:hypothetical protein
MVLGLFLNMVNGLVQVPDPYLALVKPELCLLLQVLKFGTAVFPVGPNTLYLSFNTLLLLEQLLLQVLKVSLNALFVSLGILEEPLMIHLKRGDLLLMLRYELKLFLLELVPIELSL